MSTPALSNGTAHADPLAPVIEQLQEQLAPLSARRSQLEAELSEIGIQEQRIKDGLVALRLRPARAPQKPGGSSKNQWTPSQKTQDDVYAALAKMTEPASTTQISEMCGVSRGTVEKAVHELRKKDRVRYCGQGGRGNANLYSVMPSD